MLMKWSGIDVLIIKQEHELTTRLVMVQKIAEWYNLQNPEVKQNFTSSEYRGYKKFMESEGKGGCNLHN